MGAWAPAGQRDAPAPWDLPSEPIGGPGLEAQGAGDLLAAGQLEREREKAGWDQQGPPQGLSPYKNFHWSFFSAFLAAPDGGWK